MTLMPSTIQSTQLLTGRAKRLREEALCKARASTGSERKKPRDLAWGAMPASTDVTQAVHPVVGASGTLTAAEEFEYERTLDVPETSMAEQIAEVGADGTDGLSGLSVLSAQLGCLRAHVCALRVTASPSLAI